MKVLSGCLGLLFALCLYANAQIPEGALVGTVQDATGARIVAATVRVTARTYSLSRTVKTGKLGEFSVESLPPGDYDVKV
ncbi:MAG TPA: carboxypeptidase-like regulatory domain-containing protein, partial [Candidatus Angelobacter sp.]